MSPETSTPQLWRPEILFHKSKLKLISGLTGAAVTRFLTRFSHGRFVFNDNVYHPGEKLFPRVHIRWCLEYLQDVRRIQLGSKYFYFSLSKVVPYSTIPGVWSPITDAGVQAYMNDPDFEAGLITHHSDELELGVNPENANVGNVNENDQSSGTSEFGA